MGKHRTEVVSPQEFDSLISRIGGVRRDAGENNAMDKFDEAAAEVKTETERAHKLLDKAAEISRAGNVREARNLFRQAKTAQDNAMLALERTGRNDQASEDLTEALAEEMSEAAYGLGNLDYS